MNTAALTLSVHVLSMPGGRKGLPATEPVHPETVAKSSAAAAATSTAYEHAEAETATAAAAAANSNATFQELPQARRHLSPQVGHSNAMSYADRPGGPAALSQHCDFY